MKKIAVAAVTAVLAASSLVMSSQTADAHSCTMIRGTGYGLTDGISRWMATEAVKNSANRWAAGGKHRLGPVKMKCVSPFECTGAARACK